MREYLALEQSYLLELGSSFGGWIGGLHLDDNVVVILPDIDSDGLFLKNYLFLNKTYSKFFVKFE